MTNRELVEKSAQVLLLTIKTMTEQAAQRVESLPPTLTYPRPCDCCGDSNSAYVVHLSHYARYSCALHITETTNRLRPLLAQEYLRSISERTEKMVQDYYGANYLGPFMP